MVQTQPVGVKRDFDALNAPNRARGQFAQTLGDVGEMVGQFAMKLQAAKNYGIMADADREMRQATADFQQSRIGRTDEDNWQNEWNEKAQATRSKIFDTHQIGPDLRRQLDSNFKTWDQTNAIEVRTLATKQAVNRAQERISNAANDAAKDGDEETINKLFNGASTHGIYYPEQAEALKKGYLNKIDEYAAKNYIDNFPVGAVEFLKEKGDGGQYKNLPRLSPMQRDSLLVQARQRMHAYQADNVNDIRDRIDGGEDISEDFIRLRESRGEISARGAANIRRYVLGKDLAQAKEIKDALISDVLTTDATTMRDPQEWGEQMMSDAALLPTAYRNMVTRAINNKLAAAKRQGAKEENAVQRETFARMKKDFDEGFDLPGAQKEKTDRSFFNIITLGFGGEKKVTKTTEFASDEERKNWEFSQSPENRKAAALRYAQQIDAMRVFFEQNPKATQTEAEEFRQKLVQPYILEQVSKAITPTPTVSAPPAGTIRVRAPNGKIGTIPAANREKAIAAGYSVVQ